MELGASELIVLGDDPLDNAHRLHDIASGVELMLDSNSWDDANGNWLRQARRLQNSGISFTVHPPAWDCNIASAVFALRNAALDLNRRALDVCVAVGAKQMVFHPGYCDWPARFDRKQAQQYSRQALEELIPIAKAHGIVLGVENIASPSNALYTQEEYIHLLDDVDETAQYLLDLGHAHFNGWDIPTALDAIGPRLCGLHIHDNDGRGDQHLPIFAGTIPWEAVFHSMERLPHHCHFILEYAPGTPLDRLKEGVQILRERFPD